MGGSCEGQADTAIGGMGTALGQGESSETLVSSILLTILTELSRLSLSGCGQAAGLRAT